MNGREGRAVPCCKRQKLLARKTLVKGPGKPKFSHRPPMWFGTNHFWPGKPTRTEYSQEETLTCFKTTIPARQYLPKLMRLQTTYELQKHYSCWDTSEQTKSLCRLNSFLLQLSSLLHKVYPLSPLSVFSKVFPSIPRVHTLLDTDCVDAYAKFIKLKDQCTHRQY